MFCIIELIVASFLLLFSNRNKNIYYSEQVELTPKIKVPKPIGQGQYGTGWWLNKKDFNKVFGCNVIDRTKEYNQVCLKSAGIVTHFERDGNLDKIYYINENLHTLLVGSTGSGKSRSVIIPTITMLGLAGENMCISDVKGELYLYTAENLKKIGYDVIAIDYINFLKSNKYNYLDIIINAVEQDNIPLAESLINDLVNILVEKNEKTEPIWKNGEMSVIKTAIMAVVLENKGRREYQTLPNAYYAFNYIICNNRDSILHKWICHYGYNKRYRSSRRYNERAYSCYKYEYYLYSITFCIVYYIRKNEIE